VLLKEVIYSFFFAIEAKVSNENFRVSPATAPSLKISYSLQQFKFTNGGLIRVEGNLGAVRTLTSTSTRGRVWGRVRSACVGGTREARALVARANHAHRCRLQRAHLS